VESLAAGTSTGGMTHKSYGRVGDSPIIGAGTYANNATCGVSATGHGEYFMRLLVTHDINPSTTISYSLLKQSTVRLTVLDIRGQEVVTLLDEGKPTGNYEVQWNGNDESDHPVSTGVYFCRLRAGDYSKTVKMVYLK